MISLSKLNFSFVGYICNHLMLIESRNKSPIENQKVLKQKKILYKNMVCGIFIGLGVSGYIVAAPGYQNIK